MLILTEVLLTSVYPLVNFVQAAAGHHVYQPLISCQFHQVAPNRRM